MYLTLDNLRHIAGWDADSIFHPRYVGGPIAVPYYGYSFRHLNQHGPMREVKDMTMEEIRKLEVKYDSPIRIRITLRPDTMMIK